MDTSALTDRLGGLRDRLPGGDDERSSDEAAGESDGDDDGSLVPSPPVPDAAPDVDLPDPRLTDDDSRLSMRLMLVTLLGLFVAAIAAVARYALDRVRSDDQETGAETDQPPSTPDPSESDDADDTGPEFGHDAAGATADTDEVGAETEETATAGETDGTETDAEPSAMEELLDTDDDEEGPRIAPLVGLAAQVGFRMFVEKFREESDDETGE